MWKTYARLPFMVLVLIILLSLLTWNQRSTSLDYLYGIQNIRGPTFAKISNTSKFEVANTTTSQPECPVESDLPIVNSLFVGRDNEISEIMKKIEHAHIVSINGPPGFGKSSLAVNFGYKMVKRGTSVRYIDIADVFFHTTIHLSNEASGGIKNRFHKEQTISSQATALSSNAANLPVLFLAETKRNDRTADVKIAEILEWSKSVKCYTLLILDNCDDQIYGDEQQQQFIQLMKELVNLSHNNIHIVLTSRKQLLIADDFDAVSVKELDSNSSRILLKELAPKISTEDSISIANLLEGCPIALKVIGRLLNWYDDELIPEIEEELRMHPIKLLDKASTPKERFRVIMDITFKRLLSTEQECGFYMSLFPGSFSHKAAVAVLPCNDTGDILSSYSEHSLVDEYVLGHKLRFKMHRLIREYLRDRADKQVHIKLFDEIFCKYFSEYLVEYASQITHQNITESQEHEFKAEHQNIHHLLNTLLSRTDRRFSSLEVQGLVFAVTTNFISKSNVHQLYHVMINYISSVCEIIDNEKCGHFYSEIIQQLHEKCGCKTASDFFKQLLSDKWPCEVLFTCNTVSTIITHPSVWLQLNSSEERFLRRMHYGHCKGIIVYIIKPLVLFSFHFTYFMLVICTPRQVVCTDPHHKHSPLGFICGLTCCATLPVSSICLTFCILLYISTDILTLLCTSFPLLVTLASSFATYVISVLFWPPYSCCSIKSYCVLYCITIIVWLLSPTC